MQSRSNEVRRARPLLGTFVEIAVRDLEEGRANAAIEAAFATIAEVQRRMNFHDPASALSELNRRAAQEPVEVDAWTWEVLSAAAEVHRVSDGFFDVCVGSGATFADVELLADRTVRFQHRDLRIDLGGIAKGFAVDQAVAALRECGVTNGLVNAGGDLRAFGTEAFPVAIRDPREPTRAFTTIPLRDRALATSAHYPASRAPQKAPGRITAPGRQGARPRVQSVTVCAASAMLADGLTKVVALRGAAAAPALDYFAADALIIASSGEMQCSPRWDAALQFPS